jgi:hypothetical protein
VVALDPRRSGAHQETTIGDDPGEWPPAGGTDGRAGVGGSRTKSGTTFASLAHARTGLMQAASNSRELAVGSPFLRAG